MEVQSPCYGSAGPHLLQDRTMENGEEGPVMEEETEQERERGEEGEADESVPAGEEPAAAPQNSKTRIIGKSS